MFLGSLCFVRIAEILFRNHTNIGSSVSLRYPGPGQEPGGWSSRDAGDGRNPEIYFFIPAKKAPNRLHFLKQTVILFFGAFVWVCGCKSRPVAGETIHVSGQSPVSMVRLRSKTNRVTERGSSGEPCGLRSEPSCWRVWGQRPGQPYNRHQQNTKRGKYHVRRQSFDLQGLRP